MATTTIRMAHTEEAEEATGLRCMEAGAPVGERPRAADKEAAEWAVDAEPEAAAAIEGLCVFRVESRERERKKRI